MRFSALTIASALSATAFAQSETAPATVVDLSSLASVLSTALPTSLVQLASSNPDALSSEIAAIVDSGSTPAWFPALPTDVQSILVGGAQMLSNATDATPAPTASSVSASATAPSTAPSTASSTASAMTNTPTGLAAKPTAALGGALIGAAGLLGLFAL